MTPVQAYYLSYIFSFYWDVYAVTIIIILIGTLFLNKKYKAESYNFLYTFNTLAAWSKLIITLQFLRVLYLSWIDQTSFEWYAFSMHAPYFSWSWVFILNLLSAVLGLLLFFRKLRIKRWFTVLFLISCSGFIFERVVVFMTGLYRDYLPSSWSTYYENAFYPNLFCFAVIILLLVGIYVWAKKKGRLPFPSVFLK